MTSVSIVIVNWNGFADTKECLESVAKLKIKNVFVRTLVVDNGSTDDSVKQLKGLEHDFELIESKRNLGFAGGYNVGMRYSMQYKDDYVLIINNDFILDAELLQNLLKAAQKYPKAGLISPKIYFAKGYEFHKKAYKKDELGKVIWSTGGNIDWDNVYGTNRGVDEVDSGQFEKTEETDFATGAAVLMNVKALRKVGLFDEKYFMYFEDSDLSMRMKKKKWKVIYTPKAKLWHKVAQSSGIGSDLNDYFITRNRLRFGMTYASWRTKIALLRESLRVLSTGRRWQRVGVMDYYVGNFYKGSWK